VVGLLLKAGGPGDGNVAHWQHRGTKYRGLRGCLYGAEGLTQDWDSQVDHPLRNDYQQAGHHPHLRCLSSFSPKLLTSISARQCQQLYSTLVHLAGVLPVASLCFYTLQTITTEKCRTSPVCPEPAELSCILNDNMYSPFNVNLV